VLAFLLDFDGLILDTESCALTSWTEEYAYYGLELPLDEWHAALGVDINHEGRFAVLEELAGAERFAARNSRLQRRNRHHQLIEQLDACRGVREFVTSAVAHGHPLAVVSGSPAAWVKGHLERLDMLSHFDVVATGEEVQRGKPAPDLYNLALARLGRSAKAAVAFEDTHRGVAAAVAADIACVAVPNPVTLGHDFGLAWFVAESFHDARVTGLLRAESGPHLVT
jgi:putative hydrolase of the HAD superfamily